jgi:3-polyprenyl-4-hydroxybenzoate decarboxylase
VTKQAKIGVCHQTTVTISSKASASYSNGHMMLWPCTIMQAADIPNKK